MAKNEESREIPSWIWHPAREKQRGVLLRKSFTLDRKRKYLEFFLACTGEVEAELNGVKLGGLPEHPKYSAAFAKLEGFPPELGPGEYTLILRIRCTEPMPVQPINIHLWDRSVGCIAFVRGDGFWLPTNDTWEADEGNAATVCRLGEEPYGELDNAPDWFVAGGYGDVRAVAVRRMSSITASGLEVTSKDGELTLSGTGGGQLHFKPSARGERHIFYHLLKQNEWKELRSQQAAADLHGVPKLLVALPQEMNVRFEIENLGRSELTLLWNGSESPEELEHYDGCMTEFTRVTAGCRHFSNPQGMRFFQLFVGCAEGEEFRLAIRFESVGVLMQRVGAVKSGNPLLDEIYEVAAHTSGVCHQTGLWDGVKRDRLNWAYDIYMAAKADYVLWDDLSVLKRSIRELGKTPYGYWMNAIPSYTLWWICGIWDYYWETGDREFVVEMKEDLIRHLRWVEENTDAATGDFLPGARHEGSFIEWAPMGEAESWYCLNAIYKMMRNQVQRLASYLPELGIVVRDGAPSIGEDVFFRDGAALLTPLLGMMSGYISEERAVQFLKTYELKDPVTPLSAYWLAENCSRFGLHEKAWQVISTVWGSMLDTGTTTFWESVVLARGDDYHRAQTTYTAYHSYRMSLCHSWASTPAVWISRYVLGIQPLEPGCRSFDFRPNPVAGLTECKGTVSSPAGPIQVEWKMEEGRMIKSVRVGTKADERGEFHEDELAGGVDLERAAGKDAQRVPGGEADLRARCGSASGQTVHFG